MDYIYRTRLTDCGPINRIDLLTSAFYNLIALSHLTDQQAKHFFQNQDEVRTAIPVRLDRQHLMPVAEAWISRTSSLRSRSHTRPLARFACFTHFAAQTQESTTALPLSISVEKTKPIVSIATTEGGSDSESNSESRIRQQDSASPRARHGRRILGTCLAIQSTGTDGLTSAKRMADVAFLKNTMGRRRSQRLR